MFIFVCLFVAVLLCFVLSCLFSLILRKIFKKKVNKKKKTQQEVFGCVNSVKACGKGDFEIKPFETPSGLMFIHLLSKCFVSSVQTVEVVTENLRMLLLVLCCLGSI